MTNPLVDLLRHPARFEAPFTVGSIAARRRVPTRHLVCLALAIVLAAGAPSDLHSQTLVNELSAAAREHLFGSLRTHRAFRGESSLPCQDFALSQIVVRFDPEIDERTIEKVLETLQLRTYRRLSPFGLYLLEIESFGNEDEDRQATLDLLARVERLELPLQASVDCPGEGSDVDHQTGGSRGLPSDTHAPEQWHLYGENGIDAPEAWQITKGSEEIVVAIIDSGYVPDHPEFENRIYRSPSEESDGIDDEPNGYVDDQSGWDFVAFDEVADDEHRHGSWVAGMFGAASDNGFGVAGLDHQALIMPIKVLDASNSGFTSDLIAALDYTLLHPEVRVVNLSLINYPNEPMLHDAIRALSTQTILVACAGNTPGAGTADSQFPGAYPETISISWTGESGDIAADSSSGSTVDFSAPGLNVATINPYNSLDQYHVVYGCSFATPLVSAAASLTLSIRPQTDASDFHFLMRRTATDSGADGWDEVYGWGRLDVDDLLIEAERLIFQGGFEPGDATRWK